MKVWYPGGRLVWQEGPISAPGVARPSLLSEPRSARSARVLVPRSQKPHRTTTGCLCTRSCGPWAPWCISGRSVGRVVRSPTTRLFAAGEGCSKLSQGRKDVRTAPDSAGPGTACTSLWDPPICSLEKHHVPLCHAASQSAQDDVVRMLHAGPSPRSSALQAAGCGRGTAEIRAISRASSRFEASSVVCWCRQAPC